LPGHELTWRRGDTTILHRQTLLLLVMVMLMVMVLLLLLAANSIAERMILPAKLERCGSERQA
jgi:hypothetical protein